MTKLRKTRAVTKRVKKTAHSAITKQRANVHHLIRNVVGSQVILAQSLGVTQAAVSKWLVQGFVPLQRAIEIEAMYGVPRTDIANPRIVQALASVDDLLG
jgi:DNA-binding transcriptional regulator YdaS (Cro superfamily)